MARLQPWASPGRYRAVVETAKARDLAVLPAGPVSQVGLNAAILLVGAELMTKLAGGPRAAAALLRLADKVGRRRLQEPST